MTWNAAFIFSFGAPVPGREAASLQVFADAQAYFGKLAADDKCELEAFLWPYGGGLMIVKGESAADLFEMLESDEGRRLRSTANITTEDFRYEMAVTGEAVADSLASYASVGDDLGYL
jgi:hypothetical protein